MMFVLTALIGPIKRVDRMDKILLLFPLSCAFFYAWNVFRLLHHMIKVFSLFGAFDTIQVIYVKKPVSHPHTYIT